jgi:hypothetical protein
VPEAELEGFAGHRQAGEVEEEVGVAAGSANVDGSAAPNIVIQRRRRESYQVKWNCVSGGSKAGRLLIRRRRSMDSERGTPSRSTWRT